MHHYQTRTAGLLACLALTILLSLADAVHAEDYRISTQDQFLAASERTYGPGDRVLLERGKRFLGQLRIKGKGLPDKPVIVDAFGEGPLPILDGNGLSDYQGVLQIDDSGQIEVGNLEITNAFGTKTKSYGILVQDNSGEKHSRIYIRDCYVHHITSDDSNCTAGSGDKNLGGIHLTTGNGTLWDDILVENNRIEYAGRSGITTGGWSKPNVPPPGKKPGKGGHNLEDPSDCITNLRIRKNRISYASGDGIIMRMAYKGLVEYNVVHHCGYPGNGKPTDVSASIWGANKNIDCVFQYNEAYAHFPNGDAGGFDVDMWSKGTIMQYNYSHDNAGGFILSFGPNRECVIRHNVSVNEKPFGSFSSTSGLAFENNTFYLGDGMKGTYRVWGAAMRSNLLVATQGSFSTNKSSVTSVGDYYYTPKGNNPSGTGTEAKDPGFVNPCGATSPIGLANLGGFKLKADSPCPNVGADIDHILQHADPDKPR
ncbi:MAG: hypothetical protein FJ222_09930 [Lentisphaerae bacterium]|nr:hypothetical protein [Lentisphaerota bacterium]